MNEIKFTSNRILFSCSARRLRYHYIINVSQNLHVSFALSSTEEVNLWVKFQINPTSVLQSKKKKKKGTLPKHWTLILKPTHVHFLVNMVPSFPVCLHSGGWVIVGTKHKFLKRKCTCCLCYTHFWKNIGMCSMQELLFWLEGLRWDNFFTKYFHFCHWKEHYRTFKKQKYCRKTQKPNLSFMVHDGK